MFCKNCGREIEAGGRFCDNCGTSVDGEALKQQYTPLLNKTAEYIPPENMSSSHSSAYVDSDEKLIGKLGNGYVANILANPFGRLKKCNALLTDKRVYLQGQIFSGGGSKMATEKWEKIVDVDDVTGTGFRYNNPVGIIVIGIIFLLMGMFAMIYNMMYRGYIMMYGYMGAFFLLFGLAYIILYFVVRKVYFIIEYAGGSIMFDAKSIGVADVQAFQKLIYKAKDKRKKVK